tara:strand:+ start:316 stop:540 length:225 start_codon:yes stop_codon:yes gene_type:complete
MIKKTKSLNQDQLYDMMWSNDWQIVEKTQELLTMLKKADMMGVTVLRIQELIDKKYNIIGAQMILEDLEKEVEK